MNRLGFTGRKVAEVFYEKSTAEAMAHRVAEAVRRGSATNSESCIVLWPFDTMISDDLNGWLEMLRTDQAVLIADVGRPNRLAAQRNGGN